MIFIRPAPGVVKELGKHVHTRMNVKMLDGSLKWAGDGYEIDANIRPFSFLSLILSGKQKLNAQVIKGKRSQTKGRFLW